MAFDGDWSRFDDWLEEGGKGRHWLFANGELNKVQKKIVQDNFQLLQDKKRWKDRVAEFEEALASIEDQEKREEKRGQYMIHLDRLEYDGDLDFSGRRFPCSLSFCGVEITGNIELYNAEIRGKLNFDDLRQTRTLSMEKAIVRGDISFYEAHVRGDLWLHGIEIGGDLVLDRARILAGLNLSKSSIMGELKMHCTNIGVVLSLWETYIKKNFLLSSEPGMTQKHDPHYYVLKIIAEQLRVDGSFSLMNRLVGEANFQQLKVGGATRLSYTSFKQTPDFRDALFERPPEVAGMEVPGPELAGRRYGIFRTCTDNKQVARYRKLKAMAIAANDHEKDGEFFKYEMMAKRGVEITGFWELLANSIYCWFSDYGQSWTRPIGLMFASWGLFTIIYFSITIGAFPAQGYLRFAAFYSFIETIPFLSSLYRLAPWPEEYTNFIGDSLQMLESRGVDLDWLFAISFVQQFIGLVLLFFLLLGLRNRFRLK